MKLHIVGGFLGSGKTTAIIAAAKLLMDQGRRVGVITNDQGRYLVDTAFFRLSAIPAVEVTGGCFCCNYDDLDGRLAQLIAASQPEVIFAESVGSCADIVATVVKPLLELGGAGVQPASFSVFTDGRLLRRRLQGLEMPFSDEVVYIFDKQIEEAGLLVVNKVDLLSPLALIELQFMLSARYPSKPVLAQNSLNLAGVRPWLEKIQTTDLLLPGAPLAIDYERYGAGEARMAWLDEQIALRFDPGAGSAALRGLISRLVADLSARRAGIGHLKFILQAAGTSTKLSFPSLEEPGWEARIPRIEGCEAALLVNARVELPAAELRALLHAALDASGMGYTIQSEEAFHPAQPNPTHRMG